MKYDKVRKNAPQFLSLTGFTVSEFDSLLPTFQCYRAFSSRRLKRLNRYLIGTLCVCNGYFKAAKMCYLTELNGRSNDRWILTDKNPVIAVKKTHNVKNNLLCNPQRRILWLSKTFDGHVHDKKIADEQPICFPAGITLWQDTGFLGHKPKNVTVKMPTKKPKGKNLSEQQKQENREISSFRILVEHAIGGVKRCRIVKDRFRCYKNGFDDTVMLIACGLHNFRIALKSNAIVT